MAHFLRRKLTDEGLTWSSKTVEDLKKKIFNIASSFAERETPRVLFIGESGAGKSSFISSIISTFSGTITMTSTIGYRVGHEVNNSRRFLEHKIHEVDADGRTLRLILCDSRGVSKDGQLGISEREIPLLIEGKFRHNDKIQDDSDLTHDTEIAEREPIEPSCIVFLEKAVRTGDVHDSIRDKLDLARDMIREKGIPSCLVITHIDEVEPKLKNVLGSKKVEKLINERAGEAGVTPNRVFVVKNYTDERRTHVKHDVLILRTVLSIVSDVKQRSRDKRPDLSLPPPIIQPNLASRRVRPEFEYLQHRIQTLHSRTSATSRRSQPSGAYEMLRLFSQVMERRTCFDDIIIQNSPSKNQENVSDILYEEPTRHPPTHSSDKREK